MSGRPHFIKIIVSIFDATMAALQKSLDLRMRAFETHTSNVANANVANYKSKRVDFESRMKEALEGLSQDSPLIEREGSAKQKIDKVTPEIIEDPLARPNGDGNTVNMEKEQAEIAKNTIAYQTAAQLISMKFAMAKYSIGDGR